MRYDVQVVRSLVDRMICCCCSPTAGRMTCARSNGRNWWWSRIDKNVHHPDMDLEKTSRARNPQRFLVAQGKSWCKLLDSKALWALDYSVLQSPFLCITIRVSLKPGIFLQSPQCGPLSHWCVHIAPEHCSTVSFHDALAANVWQLSLKLLSLNWI